MSSNTELSNNPVCLEADDTLGQTTQKISRNAFDFLVEFVTDGEKHQDNQLLMKQVQESLDAWYNS
jgi:hypothetical protein